MNSTGLRLSPCGVPIVVANARQSPVDRRGWSEVSASRNRIIRSSDSGISSCPLARPVLSLPIASVTSSGVIGRVSCDGSELEMMRPASSWNVSCVAGLLVISRTARNIFAPS